MVPSNTPPVSAHSGHRRRRLMESADFNGAAKCLFNGLRCAVADGCSIVAVFVSVEMSPATPGVITSTVADSLQQEDIALAMNARRDAVAAMSAGFQRLLDHPDAPADLAVYVGPAHVVSRGPAGDAMQSVGIRLEVRSVDGAAVTAFRVQPEAAPKSRLLFAPLAFRGLHDA